MATETTYTPAQGAGHTYPTASASQSRRQRSTLQLSSAIGCWPPSQRFVAHRVSVSVPATSANLGPGFDCLALALHLRNIFEVTLQTSRSGGYARPRITVRGSSEDVRQLKHKRNNLFVSAFRAVCERQGIVLPSLTLSIRINLPPSRGLGSSATAVVGGLLAANTLLGSPLSREELLDMAVACEPGHHADNVAAALYGGLVVTGVRDAHDHLVTLALPVPQDLRAVLYIPDMPMSTVRGRSLLPDSYTKADVTFNLGRVALLVGALQAGRYDVLGLAMDDRVHQPYREQMFPALREFIAAARAAGADGACLSGGGSTVLALTTGNAEAVRDAMEAAGKRLNVPGRGFIAEISRRGALARLLPYEYDDNATDATVDGGAGEAVTGVQEADGA
ncbi:MAG: homoserine kinase [Ktedonobacterales bacterium]